MKTIKKPDQTFAEYFDHKPSKALRAMVAGLRMTDEERGFKINMNTFGEVNDGVCFGCAASSTIRTCLSGPVAFSPLCYDRYHAYGRYDDYGRYGDYGLDEKNYRDIAVFETAMDCARRGAMLALFNYMDKSPKEYNFQHARFRLESDFIEADLEGVEAFATYLEGYGY